MKLSKVIISGGGTGGHIFPAIAIANEIKQQNPDAEILFIGAEGKMEMQRVPNAGYKIIGLPIAGFQRKFTLKNLLLPFKIIKSMRMAKRIIKEFNPQVVVGVGGYASGPTLKCATMLKIPTVVQEQNSFPGKTNKILSKSVTKLCTAYDGLERFFPKEKIVLTGNPVRKDVVDIAGKREDSFKHFGLNADKKTIFILGGSLGARTLNDSVCHHLSDLQKADVQVLWQCGKFYLEEFQEKLSEKEQKGIVLTDFISRMDFAYAMADVVISRAGAISVSELCLVQKPTILVPSPNVAEDHQTHNAMALVNKIAALMVKDAEAIKVLIPTALKLLKDENLQKELQLNIATMGKPNATKDIVHVLQNVME